MSEEELKEFFSVFNDCWKLIRKHSSLENSPEYWDQLVNDGNQIASDHGGTFASDVVVAVFKEMERKVKAC